MKQSRPKLWTKDFTITSIVNFFLTLVFYLLVVTIGIYAVEAYNVSTSMAGLITGMFIIGSLVGRLFTGRYIDSIGSKRTLIIGLILCILATSFYFLNFGISFLLVTRLLHGIFAGMASTAAGTIIAETIPTSRKAEGIGYFSMSATLATAIGPFIGLLMVQQATFQVIFAFCLVLGIINILIALFVRVIESQEEIEANKAKGFRISNFVEPKALPIACVTLLIAFCYSSVLSYINFYAIDIDLMEAASFFFLVYSLAVLISRPITGRLIDLKGANIIMYPALIIFAGGMLLLSTANSGFTLLLAGALIGLGFGNLQSGSQAIAVKLTPPHHMGLATSTFFIFLDAGLGFGPYLLGFIIPFTGYRSLYVILGITILAIIVLYHFLHGKKDRLTMEGHA